MIFWRIDYKLFIYKIKTGWNSFHHISLKYFKNNSSYSLSTIIWVGKNWLSIQELEFQKNVPPLIDSSGSLCFKFERVFEWIPLLPSQTLSPFFFSLLDGIDFNARQTAINNQLPAGSKVKFLRRIKYVGIKVMKRVQVMGHKAHRAAPGSINCETVLN